MKLSQKEKIRYGRHISLPQFGEETQLKLKASKVLVVGTGGLGTPLLHYLTAAGVGTIGVVDYDIIDESNLQRQVLFSTLDVGYSKTSVAIQKLKKQNPHVEFVEYHTKLETSNALEIISDYDVIADGTDNFPTRYLVNDACVLTDKINVYASIFQYEGQVSVFNYQNGPNYRDLFPTPPPPDMVPSCAEGGVLGVLPGIIGSLQALEVIKVLTGIGHSLSGKLFVFDALDFSTRMINVRKDPTNPLNGEHSTITIEKLIDYEEFCKIKKVNLMKTMTVSELKEMQDNKEDITLIDVRESDEFEAGNIGGKSVPLSKLEHHVDQFPKEGKVVVYCRTGRRSATAINLLETKYNYTNLFNLDGGVTAWRDKIDPMVIVI